jgi:hypothetical protein
MDPQANSGTFMGGNGQGSALLRLMKLRAMTQGGGGSAMNQNTANPGMVQPASPPTGSAMPAGMAQSQSPQFQMSQPPQGAVAENQAPQQAPVTPDTNLQIAMSALGNYIKAHGDAHKAIHGVDLQKARAQAMMAQNAPQQGGQ